MWLTPYKTWNKDLRHKVTCGYYPGMDEDSPILHLQPLETYPSFMAHEKSISLHFIQKVKQGVSTLDVLRMEAMKKPWKRDI